MTGAEWLEPSFEQRRENDLPEGWAYVALANVGEWGSGGTPSKARAEFWKGGTVPWVSPKDMKTSFLADAQDHITQYAVSSGAAAVVPPGTLLFVVRGMILAHTFPVAITRREVAFNQDMRSVMPNATVHAPYLLRVLQHEAMSILFAVKEATHGTLRLDSETLRPWPIPLPPLAEQRRIVDKVEALLAEVDAARARLAKVRPILKRFRQSILAAACSGRLTEDWRRGRENETPRDLVDLENRRAAAWEALNRARGRSRKYVPPVTIGEDHLPEIPESWSWLSADAVCSQVTDGEHIQPKYQATGYPMLTATHVRDGVVEFRDYGLIAEPDFKRCLERCAPTKNDLLVVSVGATTGRAALVADQPPFAIVRSVLLLRPLINPRFLLRWAQSPWCFRWMTGASGASAQPHFYIGDAKRMPIAFPSLSEQHEIVRRVDALFALADAIEGRVAAATARADRLTQSILAKAFRGELVPTEADLAREEGRAYESAAALLERIRADAPGVATRTPRRRSRGRAAA